MYLATVELQTEEICPTVSEMCILQSLDQIPTHIIAAQSGSKIPLQLVWMRGKNNQLKTNMYSDVYLEIT